MTVKGHVRVQFLEGRPGLAAGTAPYRAANAGHATEPRSSTTDRFESNDLAVYFEELGEIWAIIGCVHRGPNGEVINLPHALAGWRNALDAANLFMDAHGARYPREAHAGIVGIHGAWVSLDYNNARQSIKDKVELRRRHQQWDHPAQLQFRVDLLTKLRGAFALPAITIDDMVFIEQNRNY